MIILGLNTGDHDAAACLVRDGRLINYVEEERLVRVKHAVGHLPEKAVEYCLADAGISMADVDRIAVPWVDNNEHRANSPGARVAITFDVHDDVALERCPRVQQILQQMDTQPHDIPPVSCVSHHLAHASAAYRCSGYQDAAILVVDGWGDRVATTIASGNAGVISAIQQWPIEDSLGYFYAAVTYYLGMGQFGEGKTMGLAPYGTGLPLFESLINLEDNNFSIRLGLIGDRWDPSDLGPDKVFSAWMRELHRLAALLPAEREAVNGRPPAVLAASAQNMLERSISHLAEMAIRKSGSRNLALGGGVALNCSANGKLGLLPFVDSLFIQPIAHDGGNAIGAALEVAARAGDGQLWKMSSTSLGPHYSDTRIRSALKAGGVSFREVDNISSMAAQRLSEGAIVGWFQGRSEGGPRALGQRSILGNPSTVEQRDRLNKVKRRELWRPIAPAVRIEDVNDIFEDPGSSPFMILAKQIKSSARDAIPGIVHVDGSARPQTVDKRTLPTYWRMLEEFQRLSGASCVMNTSFNDEKEPIVCSPEDAVKTFLSTGMDCLAIGNYEVTQK